MQTSHVSDVVEFAAAILKSREEEAKRIPGLVTSLLAPRRRSLLVFGVSLFEFGVSLFEFGVSYLNSV